MLPSVDNGQGECLTCIWAVYNDHVEYCDFLVNPPVFQRCLIVFVNTACDVSECLIDSFIATSLVILVKNGS